MDGIESIIGSSDFKIWFYVLTAVSFILGVLLFTLKWKYEKKHGSSQDSSSDSGERIESIFNFQEGQEDQDKEDEDDLSDLNKLDNRETTKTKKVQVNTSESPKNKREKKEEIVEEDEDDLDIASKIDAYIKQYEDIEKEGKTEDNDEDEDISTSGLFMEDSTEKKEEKDPFEKVITNESDLEGHLSSLLVEEDEEDSDSEEYNSIIKKTSNPEDIDGEKEGDHRKDESIDLENQDDSDSFVGTVNYELPEEDEFKDLTDDPAEDYNSPEKD